MAGLFSMTSLGERQVQNSRYHEGGMRSMAPDISASSTCRDPRIPARLGRLLNDLDSGWRPKHGGSTERQRTRWPSRGSMCGAGNT
jgi:hypothetical protein